MYICISLLRIEIPNVLYKLHRQRARDLLLIPGQDVINAYGRGDRFDYYIGVGGDVFRDRSREDGDTDILVNELGCVGRMGRLNNEVRLFARGLEPGPYLFFS